MNNRRVDRTDPRDVIARIAREDSRSKIAVIEAIGVLAERGVLDPGLSRFLAESYGDDPKVDHQVILSASKLAQKNVLLPELMKKVNERLYDAQDWVRIEACYAIGRLAMSGLYDKGCLPIFMKMLKDESMRVRAGTCIAIAGLATQSVIERKCLVPIISLLREENAKDAASFAIGVLARKGTYDPTCLPGLYAILDDESDGALQNARRSAANALSKLAHQGVCDPQRLDRFILLIEDKDVKVRRAAVSSISALLQKGIYDKTCLGRLVKLLADADSEVRSEATCALWYLAMKDVYDVDCLPRLIELLDDRNDLTRFCALATIHVLIESGEYSPSILTKIVLLLHDEECMRSAAETLESLAHRGIYDESSLPRLVEMLEMDKTKSEAGSVLLVLMRRFDVFDPNCLKGAVALLMGDDDSQKRTGIRLVCCLAMKGVVDLGCLPVLISLIDDPDDEISEDAFKAVATIRTYEEKNSS